MKPAFENGIRLLLLLSLGLWMTGCGTTKSFVVDSTPNGALLVLQPKVGNAYANGIGIYRETAICETPATTKINFWQDNCEVNLMVEKRGYEPAIIPVTKDSDLEVSCTLQKIEGVEENKFSKEDLNAQTYALLPPHVEVYVHSGVGRLDKTEKSSELTDKVTQDLNTQLAGLANDQSASLIKPDLPAELINELQALSPELHKYFQGLDEKRLAYYSRPPLLCTHVPAFKPFLDRFHAQSGNDRPYLIYAWNKCISETSGRKVGNIFFSALGAGMSGVGGYSYDPSAFNPDSGTLTVLYVIDAATSEVVHMEQHVFADITDDDALKQAVGSLAKFPRMDAK